MEERTTDIVFQPHPPVSVDAVGTSSRLPKSMTEEFGDSAKGQFKCFLRSQNPQSQEHICAGKTTALGQMGVNAIGINPVASSQNKKRKYIAEECPLVTPSIHTWRIKRQRGSDGGKEEKQMQGLSRKRKAHDPVLPSVKIQRIHDSIDQNWNQKGLELDFPTIITIGVCFYPEVLSFLGFRSDDEELVFHYETLKLSLPAWAPRVAGYGQVHSELFKWALYPVAFCMPKCPPCKQHNSSSYGGGDYRYAPNQFRGQLFSHMRIILYYQDSVERNNSKITYRTGIGWHVDKMHVISREIHILVVRGSRCKPLLEFRHSIGWNVCCLHVWRGLLQQVAKASGVSGYVAFVYDPRPPCGNSFANQIRINPFQLSNQDGLFKSIADWACRGGTDVKPFQLSSSSGRSTEVESRDHQNFQAGTAHKQTRQGI